MSFLLYERRHDSARIHSAVALQLLRYCRSERFTFVSGCSGGRAIGSCQPRRIAMNRSPKQSSCAGHRRRAGGNRSIRPITTAAAPIRAATAYSSVRKTVGISLTSTSRTMPPPIPVSMPSSVAATGPAWKASALPAPETAKRRQSGGIEHQHGAAQPVDDSIPKERNQPGKHGNGDISPVADSRWWNRSNHQIARDPARIACREGQYQNTKQIEPVPHRSRRSAERKHERAAKIERHQQSVDHDVLVDDHQAYIDNQACAATTSASTPVSKVGWITGAKRGL